MSLEKVENVTRSMLLPLQKPYLEQLSGQIRDQRYKTEKDRYSSILNLCIEVFQIGSMLPVLEKMVAKYSEDFQSPRNSP